MRKTRIKVNPQACFPFFFFFFASFSHPLAPSPSIMPVAFSDFQLPSSSRCPPVSNLINQTLSNQNNPVYSTTGTSIVAAGGFDGFEFAIGIRWDEFFRYVRVAKNNSQRDFRHLTSPTFLHPPYPHSLPTPPLDIFSWTWKSNISSRFHISSFLRSRYISSYFDQRRFSWSKPCSRISYRKPQVHLSIEYLFFWCKWTRCGSHPWLCFLI